MNSFWGTVLQYCGHCHQIVSIAVLLVLRTFALRDYGTATWEGGDAGCDHKPSDEQIIRAIGKTGLDTISERQKEAKRSQMAYRSVCGKCGARRVDQQIGLEATPSEFIDKLVAVFAEVRRVLHPSGQLFLNISDTRSDSREWLGIPHRLVFALQADGWRWEDEVIWAKKAPMPGSQTNRFTRAHEYVFMLNKSRDAFFDGEAVREPMAESSIIRQQSGRNDFYGWNRKNDPRDERQNGFRHEADAFDVTRGANKRSVWTLGPESYSGSHYATFPTKLVEPCVLSGSSQHGVCAACGSPWQRRVELGGITSKGGSEKGRRPSGNPGTDFKGGSMNCGEFVAREHVTLGWTATCQCGADVVPAVVLDPFCGSGTTLAVALKFGRRAIGIDLDPRNEILATQRIEQTQPLLLLEVT